MRARLDATDWRILKELQANGRITNVELARKVGISPPPCLRRVRALEQAGMIAGYFALLDEKTRGFRGHRLRHASGCTASPRPICAPSRTACWPGRWCANATCSRAKPTFSSSAWPRT